MLSDYCYVYSQILYFHEFTKLQKFLIEITCAWDIRCILVLYFIFLSFRLSCILL